jgi:hypothetical protein
MSKEAKSGKKESANRGRKKKRRLPRGRPNERRKFRGNV